MNLIGFIGNATLQAGRRLAAHRAADSLAIENISVVSRLSTESMLRVAYSLRSEEQPSQSGRHAVYLDSTRTLFHPLDLRRLGADGEEQWAARERLWGTLVEIPVAPDDGARIEMDFQWPTGASSPDSCLLIPGSVPYLITNRDRDGLRGCTTPPIHVDVDGYQIGGVWKASASLDEGLLQCILLPSATAEVVDDHLLLTVGVAALLTSQERLRVARLVGRILDFLAERTRLRPRVVVAAKLDSERVSRGYVPPGACIGVSRESFGFGGGEVEDFSLATQLAGIWWGVGCQVAGRGAAELESGIRMALGLLWTEHIANEAVLEGALDRCVRYSNSSRLTSVRAHLVGDVALRDATGIAVRLYRRLKAGPATMVALQTLTNESWGKRVPVHRVAGALGLSPGAESFAQCQVSISP